MTIDLRPLADAAAQWSLVRVIFPALLMEVYSELAIRYARKEKKQ